LIHNSRPNPISVHKNGISELWKKITESVKLSLDL